MFRVSNHAGVPAPSRRWVSSAAILSTIAVWACFVALWSAMWLPVYVWRVSFTLFMYPAFLSFWVVLEIAAITAVVFGVTALVLDAAPEKRTAVIVAIVTAAGFVLVSFFLLWFGNAPLALVGVDLDGWFSGLASAAASGS